MAAVATLIPFDTLAFVKELETAGVPPLQAEAHAKILVTTLQKVEETRRVEFVARENIETLKEDIEALKKERNGLATKGDIKALEGDIKALDLNTKAAIKELEVKMDAKLETTKAELRRDIEASKVDIIKWMIGASGLIVALIKLLPGGH